MTPGGDKSFELRLAERICGFDGSAVTNAGKARARNVIIDTLADALAGMSEPGPQLVMKTTGIAQGAGNALVPGTDIRADVLNAALANATASQAKASAGVRTSASPLVTALLALGEERKLGGKDVLLAFLAGIATELALTQGKDAEDQGTFALIAIAVAAAVSSLLKLAPQATATALTIAGSLATGPKADSGGVSKLLAGGAARLGLMAALMSEGGFKVSHAALEQRFDAGRVLDGWRDEVAFENAPDTDELWNSFNARARRILPREQIAPLFERLETFEAAADIGQITQLMQVSRLHDRAKPKPVSFARRGTEEAQETNWVP